MGDPALYRAATVKQITKYYYTLLHIVTRVIQLDIVAKGNVGALDFIRTVCLDRYGKQEFQSSVPYIIWIENRALEYYRKLPNFPPNFA